jgi:hypothetical protein
MGLTYRLTNPGTRGHPFRTPLWIMLLLTAAGGAVGWELIKATTRRARRLRDRQRQALEAVRTAPPDQRAEGV